MNNYHIPVMLKEVLKFLDVQSDCWYIDCNLGGGGHTSEILQRGGNVLGVDLDSDAINEVSKYQISNIKDQKLILGRANFVKIKELVDELGLKNIKGVLFDLGVSTHQLEETERGFSFNKDASLDMRMDKTAGVTAKDLINGLHEGELAELFLKLGEENFSKPIARKIVEYRKSKLIETTNELANMILSVRKRTAADRTHPATRVFQALRIAVNDELNSLREALPKALDVLDKGGRIVVISFHSLEDRIVKNYFKEWEGKGIVKILTKKPVEPTKEEIDKNPRARSGKLRAIVKAI